MCVVGKNKAKKNMTTGGLTPERKKTYSMFQWDFFCDSFPSNFFVLQTKVILYFKSTPDVAECSRWAAQCHSDNQKEGNWTQPELKWISWEEQKKMHVVHYYIFISSKMLRKAFIAWEGVADEFLTEIMCSGVSASACRLNKYLPQPRGRTEPEGSSSCLKKYFVWVCVCFLFSFLPFFLSMLRIMHSCIL